MIWKIFHSGGEMLNASKKQKIITGLTVFEANEQGL